jgi:hypothetical protein
MQSRKQQRKNAPMSKPATGQQMQESQEESELVFADERTKVAWEVGQAVSQITRSLPPEDQNLRAKTIFFDPEYISKGTYAILFSGTVIGTDQEGTFLVPERSLNVLDQLGIPYHAA